MFLEEICPLEVSGSVEESCGFSVCGLAVSSCVPVVTVVPVFPSSVRVLGEDFLSESD